MAEQRHATMSKQTTKNTVRGETYGYDTLQLGNTKNTVIGGFPRLLTNAVFLCYDYQEGEYNATHGAAPDTSRRIRVSDHRSGSQETQCVRELSEGLDTEEETTGLQVWQARANQKSGSGEVYRRQQNVAAKRKASVELADKTNDPLIEADNHERGT